MPENCRRWPFGHFVLVLISYRAKSTASRYYVSNMIMCGSTKRGLTDPDVLKTGQKRPNGPVLALSLVKSG